MCRVQSWNMLIVQLHEWLTTRAQWDFMSGLFSRPLIHIQDSSATAGLSESGIGVALVNSWTVVRRMNISCVRSLPGFCRFHRTSCGKIFTTVSVEWLYTEKYIRNNCGTGPTCTINGCRLCRSMLAPAQLRSQKEVQTDRATARISKKTDDYCSYCINSTCTTKCKPYSAVVLTSRKIRDSQLRLKQTLQRASQFRKKYRNRNIGKWCVHIMCVCSHHLWPLDSSRVIVCKDDIRI